MYLLDWAIELLMASVHFVKLPGLFQNDPQKSPQYCPIFNAHVWPQKSPNISQFSHVCSQRRPVNFPRWQQPLTTGGAGGKNEKLSSFKFLSHSIGAWGWKYFMSQYTWLDWTAQIWSCFFELCRTQCVLKETAWFCAWLSNSPNMQLGQLECIS